MGTPTMAARGGAIESINPATEEGIATFEQFTPAQVEQALVEGDAAFHQWRQQSFAERSRAMRGAAELLRKRKDRYAGLTTAEMGKPITQAEAEVEKCAWVCEYFADNAERFLARRPPKPTRDSATSRSSRQAWCSRWCPGTFRSGQASAL